jgi:acyl carrier protein phosphodiesterase
MNFVINIYLAGHLPTQDKIFGSFIGEYARMPVEVNPEISGGIYFSNKIFDFIKTHESFYKTRDRINYRYLKLQEEFVLLSYCHFLAAHWNEYSKVNWESALGNTCAVLRGNWEHIPYKLRTVLPILISNKGLLKINTMVSIDNYLNELTRKRFVGGKIKDTMQDLLGNYSSIKKDFEELMPDLDFYIKHLIALEETQSKPAVLANAS